MPVASGLQELKGKEGILGAVLSGAGPSVLIFLDPRASAQKARKVVAAHLSRKGLVAELIPTAITSRGARPPVAKALRGFTSVIRGTPYPKGAIYHIR